MVSLNEFFFAFYTSLGAGILFAVALICAGQTAGITATLAGQVVSEGFIQWTVSVSDLKSPVFSDVTTIRSLSSVV